MVIPGEQENSIEKRRGLILLSKHLNHYHHESRYAVMVEERLEKRVAQSRV